MHAFKLIELVVYVQNCGGGSTDALALAGTLGYLGPVSCDKFFGYTWWITWYVFFLTILIPILTAAGSLNKFRAGLLGLMGPATMLCGDAANTFNYWNHVPVGSTAVARARTMMAGCIVSAISLFVIIILVGIVDEKSERLETTGEPTGETYGGRYTQKPGTETSQYNPTFSQEAGEA